MSLSVSTIRQSEDPGASMHVRVRKDLVAILDT
jgi:hypothetical protein